MEIMKGKGGCTITGSHQALAIPGKILEGGIYP